jgi:type IV secretion system protein VirB6
MDLCTTASHGSLFVSSMTGYIDCQARVLGSGAWEALSMPGSTLHIVLAGFLTIFIALIGYNLLLGGSLTVRGGTVAFVKIGAVFALATSWPAYRTVIYDLVTDGPGQLVREIGPRAGIVGSDNTLVLRLDLTDRALVELAVLGTGGTPADQTDVPPPPFGGFDAFALGGSRILFLLTAIGGLAVARIVAALMLALGPFFVAFLMFESTRSLFEGWIRVLGGAALAGIGVSIVLGLELALLDPWLSGAIAQRIAGQPVPTVSTELFVISCLFAMVMMAVLYSSVRLSGAFRLAPFFGRHLPSGDENLTKGSNSRVSAEPVTRSVAPERTRAAAIASLFHSAGVREARGFLERSAGREVGSRGVEVREGGSETDRPSIPLGRSFTRKPGARVSARATRRDSSS